MTGPRGVAILGATGSIGRSALAVIDRHPERFRVAALTAHTNGQELDELAVRWQPELTVLSGTAEATFEPRWAGRWGFGEEGLADAIELPSVHIVLNALVGVAGLGPTLRTLHAGKRLALANKESLVAGGELVMEALARGGGELLPVDSEHGAAHQCLGGRHPSEIRRLVLTASGGPFRRLPAEALEEVTPEQALDHPTWDMGAKITIDSATLANKALEVIEAHHLFGLPYDRIDVVVHPTSIVHAMVELHDGSMLAQLGRPTMEVPILHALAWPERLEDDRHGRAFDPLADGPLAFEPLRRDAFPMFALGVEAGRAGGRAPIAYNAANEVAVQGFLERRVAFPAIARVVRSVLDDLEAGSVEDVDDVWAADANARARAGAVVEAASAGTRGRPTGDSRGSGHAPLSHEA